MQYLANTILGLCNTWPMQYLDAILDRYLNVYALLLLLWKDGKTQGQKHVNNIFPRKFLEPEKMTVSMVENLTLAATYDFWS